MTELKEQRVCKIELGHQRNGEEDVEVVSVSNGSPGG